MRKPPKTLTYDITLDDIEAGTPCSKTDCPHARAIKRKTGADRVAVYGGRVSVRIGERVYYYSVPTATAKFEGAYDTGLPVSPGRAVAKFCDEKPITKAKGTRRQAAVNEARNARRAALRAKGEAPKTYRTRVFTADGPIREREAEAAAAAAAGATAARVAPAAE